LQGILPQIFVAKRVRFNKVMASVCSCLLAGMLIFSPVSADANNLTVSNVTIGARNPSSGTVVISFDVSWENAWRTKINHDAAWLTVRLSDPAAAPTDKKLARVTTSGLNPAGTSIAGNSTVELYVPSDRAGVFIRPATYGKFSEISVSKVEITVDYTAAGFTSADRVYATVVGLEMVYVPAGAFYAGDGATSTAAFVSGSADTDPWYLVGEDAISVSNPEEGGYRYVSAENLGEALTATSFTIPAGFPKGAHAFYTMKYEITEGQWAEFVNSLSSVAAREHRDITDGTHKNGDTVRARNTVSCAGTPLVCATERPARAVGYLSWMDVAAFLDWAALRPMSELEYEKMARGPVVENNGEYA
jgi:formylglycine-generating enzyme required for sulfatase activity